MRGLAVGLSLVLTLLASSVRAQPEDAVVVTAPRFPEDVRRLPASVTVLSAADIAQSSARTLPELLGEQVGINMRDLYGNNAAAAGVDLRGYGATGAQNTLILLDGRRLNDIDLSGVQWSAIPLGSIERIEILRGSGAVLYGDGASAGVINIVTRSPLARGNRLEAFARAAGYNTREGQLYGSAAGETLGINATLYGYASDGYRANNRNEQRNDTLNLRWALGEGALDLNFATDRQDLRLPGGRLVQPSIGLDQYASDPRGAQTPLDYASRDGARAGANFMQRFGDAEFTVGLHWRDKDQRSYFDQMGFPTYRADALDVTSLTPRLRVPFALGDTAHRLVIGADWYAWRYRSRRSNVPENVGRPINRVTVDEDTRAVYLQDTIDVTRATLLTLGWRDERVTYAGDDALDPGAPGFSFNTAAPPARAKQHQNAWEIGLRQRIAGAWVLFARAGRSFRFVNAEEIYENDAFFNAQFQILRPQHARSYEAGAEWRSAPWRLRGTLFRSDVTDEIHLDPFTTGVGNTNLPPSRRQGLELDAHWQATRALRLAAAYAYTDARFLEGVLPGSAFAIGTDIDIAGRRVPLVPEHKLNLALAWDLAARVQLSGALSALCSQYMDNDEPNTLGRKIPAYAVLDLKLVRSFGWGRVALTVNNALDRRYYSYAARSAFVADRYAVYPLAGRSFGLSAELALD